MSMDKRVYDKSAAEEITEDLRSSDGKSPARRCKQNGLKLFPVLSPHCNPMVDPFTVPWMVNQGGTQKWPKTAREAKLNVTA